MFLMMLKCATKNSYLCFTTETFEKDGFLIFKVQISSNFEFKFLIGSKFESNSCFLGAL